MLFFEVLKDFILKAQGTSLLSVRGCCYFVRCFSFCWAGLD